MSYYEKAATKLKNEIKSVSGQKEKAIKSAVFEMLESFCRQEEEFAQAIAQSDKTFSDCLKECVKGVGTHISDIEVYRRACAFYFATATVDMVMKIDLARNRDIKVSSNSSQPQKESKESSVLNLSFSDLFD